MVDTGFEGCLTNVFKSCLIIWDLVGKVKDLKPVEMICGFSCIIINLEQISLLQWNHSGAPKVRGWLVDSAEKFFGV